MLWDVFISHASEDKESFVDPLARRLRDLAVRVWYDKFTLVPGDRLTERIGEGLAKSRCGLLVFSRAFITKPWPKYEISGLVNRFVEDNVRLVPVWLDISRRDIADFNPALADLVAIKGNVREIERCALEILRVVRPQLYANVWQLSQLSGAKVKFAEVSRDEIKSGPIRHHDLPESLLVRIQNIWFAMRDVFDRTLDAMIKGFQRDLRPEREVCIWEKIVGATQIAMDSLATDEIDVKQQVFQTVIRFSMGDHERVFADVDAGKLDDRITYAAAHGWVNVVPGVTVSDVENDGS